MKQKLIELKEEIDKYTMVVENFKIQSKKVKELLVRKSAKCYINGPELSSVYWLKMDTMLLTSIHQAKTVSTKPTDARLKFVHTQLL